jgi:hypothetical protein
LDGSPENDFGATSVVRVGSFVQLERGRIDHDHEHEHEHENENENESE